jgi:hypothetical protein
MAFNHRQAAKETGLSLLPLLGTGVIVLVFYEAVHRWGTSGAVGCAIVFVLVLTGIIYWDQGRN